ncbi:hypothetical protein Back11_14980 [Paenibacillus baekrokdamisoli]|uniref:Uncharacterized protein n=1 Tax=Paenibacillus baekrokdamisoli TaxID=1712516 RepID=A0A3G9J5T0_9BACL|nr:hypothetical protein [Paenibacillus baekrokdamisoli]MBB3072763.1 hypothetical protein [Paenibacillus baekrokdamisoli]BBH20153.1 hypothetical protein Back11_14980 [Paenibacillus baekrokdamisoli]
MYGKLVCVLVLAAAMLVYDIPKFRRACRRDQLVYGALLAALLYLGFIFVTAKPWPNLDTIFNILIKPAKQIVQWLNPKSS